MTFTGAYSRTIDEKGRVSIPKAVRAMIANGAESPAMYVAPGTDGSLDLYTEDGFENLARRLEALSPTQQEVRAFSRMFYGQAERLQIDRQGRLRVPGDLAEWAGLQREAILLGVRDHLELWEPARWDAYRTTTKPRYDEIAASAFGVAAT